MDVKELSFEFLDNKYKPLMHKFDNKYHIPGYDTEDIIQELRISLVKAQRQFDPDKGAAFGTYLYATFEYRMRGIWIDTQGRKKHIPDKKIVSMESIIESSFIENNDLDNIDVLTGLGIEATIISKEIFRGNTSNRSWLAAGLSQKEINLGKQEILDAITGGNKTHTFASKE